MKKWTRSCPGCGTEIVYSGYKWWWKANNGNRKCRPCSRKGIAIHTEVSKRKIRAARAKQSPPWLGCARPEMLGDNNPAKRPDVRRKISLSLKGRTHSAETLKKMRISRIEELEKKHGQLIPNYNPKACVAIEEYGKAHGYDFQHAENGGEFHVKELGYWVDGYDEEKNVVIEVDEEHHYAKCGELKVKDKQRQQEIEQFLGCRFVRIQL